MKRPALRFGRFNTQICANLSVWGITGVAQSVTLITCRIGKFPEVSVGRFYFAQFRVQVDDTCFLWVIDLHSNFTNWYKINYKRMSTITWCKMISDSKSLSIAAISGEQWQFSKDSWSGLLQRATVKFHIWFSTVVSNRNAGFSNSFCRKVDPKGPQWKNQKKGGFCLGVESKS